jgi:hypothetical protein
MTTKLFRYIRAARLEQVFSCGSVIALCAKRVFEMLTMSLNDALFPSDIASR